MVKPNMNAKFRHKVYLYSGHPAQCLPPIASAGIDIDVARFTAPEKLLKALRSKLCDVLVADLPINDPTVIQKIPQIAPCLPIIALVEPADITTSVSAMKLGAFGAIERPPQTALLRETLVSALRLHHPPLSAAMQPLSKTEAKLLPQILTGKSCSQIALSLARSPRTIEFHRENIMKKLKARNLMDLFRLVSIAKCPCWQPHAPAFSTTSAAMRPQPSLASH